MKVTREEIAFRAEERRAIEVRRRASARWTELIGLVFGAIVIAVALWLVYAAKTHDLAAEESAALNLNEINGPQQLTPLLGAIPSEQQDAVANAIYARKREGARFQNVGAIERIRVDKHALINGGAFAQIKPLLRVRDASAFRRSFLLWSALFFVSYFAVHIAWRVRGFTGDQIFLPAMLVLSGIGLVLMVSLRDPLRDTLMFSDFASGVLTGCVALAVFAMLDYERMFGRLTYVPLIAALLLALALGIFGSGPGVSDAKVNLFFFQPVEIIRILLVFFLAGYFAANWDALRQLRGRRGKLAAKYNMPRLDYLLPLAAGVGLSVALFFWLKDLGPALVIGALFLTLYTIARNRAGLALGGLAIIILSFGFGYLTGHPHTVSERVHMWLSPWDNHVHGGDQLADSLWSLSTGGGTGTGFGLGSSETMPAAHTDLIVSALGEQGGAIGILVLYLLYGVLIARSLRIAMRAPGTYSFFLVAGLALVLAFQILLITGGLLGLIPLSGVVSPFLSYGRTSMVANFILFAIVLSVSSRQTSDEPRQNFGGAMRGVMALLAVLFVIVIARFGWVQIVRANQTLIRPTLVLQADGIRRYQYNPRLMEAARLVPKGTIFDRNGLPLASSDWAQIESHQHDYAAAGVVLNNAAAHNQERFYPLGGPLFYLLGDTRTRLKQGASNTAFLEKTSRIRLQGYDDVAEVEQVRDSETGQITPRLHRDYAALIPLVRHRYEPENPEFKAIMERPRDVHMSIDARLQMRASEILKRDLTALQQKNEGSGKGALVVMDPDSGDLLAAVSYPWPNDAQLTQLEGSPQAPLPDEDLLDRARFGLYPPGSSFKIVTAIAALRKDPALATRRFDCVRLPDGRVGSVVRKHEIRDDIRDTQPHGSVDLRKGIVVSCNAYFAQLGTESVGADQLFDTASRLGISVARPNTAHKLAESLPQASYGQGQVVASPFQMARVAATIANGGNAPEGRWIIDESNGRVRTPEALLSPDLALQIAGMMRGVVTSGTGRVLAAGAIPIAGKTGTAELPGKPSHAWFIGFAPYGSKQGKRIAFAVLIENGQYGGTTAAPVAGEIVAAARQLGLI
jgi:cell division protein FtsI/penicillin-binding protein 2/cell division protein FtsW (lipid II flippase)